MRDGRPGENRGVVPINTIDPLGPGGVLVPLERFVGKRWLRQRSPIICETCRYSKYSDPAINENMERDVRERISRSPEYLVLQVTNFARSQGREIKGVNQVRIPMWLDLNQHRHEPQSYHGPKDDLRYKLWSAIFHTGGARVGQYDGIFVGPCGPKHIDATRVNDVTSPDEMGSKSLRTTIAKCGIYKNRDKVGEYKENQGKSPYILIYKRLKPRAQRSETVHEKDQASATTPNTKSPSGKGTGSNGNGSKRLITGQTGEEPSKRKSSEDQAADTVEPDLVQDRGGQRKRRKTKSK